MIDPTALRELFDSAIALPAGSRAAFLSTACAGDSSLRREVERLLEAYDRAGSALDTTPTGHVPQAPRSQTGSRSMSLHVGSRIGPYEIIQLLGAGGMGEVYRARDTRLDRTVAIKVLPSAMTLDASARSRFEREARAVASLSHPNICTLHDIGRQDGVDFLVMEYVGGETLAARLTRGRLTVDEALGYAIQIAAAVAAAHRRGIIHRDLKPANVIVSDDGAAKVLDFGLAKLVAAAPSPDDDTRLGITDPGLSMAGTIVGTAAYMAPEQASGGLVDARSDIFSFGSTLYEMVTGLRAFAAASTADTLNAVLHSQPERPTAVVHGLSSKLEAIIVGCLRKSPDERYQRMDDAKQALVELRKVLERSDAWPLAMLRRHPWRSSVVGVGVLVLAGLLTWRPTTPPTERPSPRVVPLTTLTGPEGEPTFAPDGNQVAFLWGGEKGDNQDIYIKMIGSSEVRRVTDDPAPDDKPSWSPDGRLIAFVRVRPEGNSVHVVSPLGGADRRLAEFPGAATVAWSPDSRWVAVAEAPGPPDNTSSRFGIDLIPVDGGTRRTVVSPVPNAAESLPAFSPDGRVLAFSLCAPGCDVYVVELSDTFAPIRAPRRLTQRSVFLVISLAWAADGQSVIYAAADQPYMSHLWRIASSGNGAPERIELAGLGAGSFAVSASQARLAFGRFAYDMDIYRFVAGGPSASVAGSTFGDMHPRLSSNGLRVAFSSLRSGEAAEIWIANADGSSVRQLTRGPGRLQGSPWWSPDDRRIAFSSLGDDGQSHIWVVDAEGGTPRQLTADSGNQHAPYWSADGNWIYFSAEQATATDIWRVPASGGRSERVTKGGSGLFASESVDGNDLLYQQSETDSPLLAMPLSGGPARQLVACVKRSAFAARRDGVHYVACDSSDNPQVRVFDPKTGRDQLVGILEKYDSAPPTLGLAVSADGKSILYHRHMAFTADLMLIENFR